MNHKSPHSRSRRSGQRATPAAVFVAGAGEKGVMLLPLDKKGPMDMVPIGPL